MKKMIPILLALALILSLCTASAESNEVLGKPFPDFTVTDTRGNTFSLSEALKDHEAVLLNLWATWCPPCEAEFPFLIEAYEQFKDTVSFIALSCEDNDTNAAIEEYGTAHRIPFPMGRDENRSLFSYVRSSGIPVTVIIDRFGSAGFIHTGSFMNAGDIMRTIEAFLGDGYTDSVILTEIPRDTSTRAFPVSRVASVQVENENARQLIFRIAEIPDTVYAYVIPDDTARLRLEITAADSPASVICYDYGCNAYLSLSGLLDPQRNVYVYESPVSGAGADIHYNYVALADSESGTVFADAYLIAGEENIEALADDFRSWGYTPSWEDADPAAEEKAALQGYILHVVDQDGAPVPGVIVNFCTDTACTMCQSDESGTILFDGAEKVYHIQLLKAPDGYGFDPGFDMYTDSTYSEWALRIRKN